MPVPTHASSPGRAGTSRAGPIPVVPDAIPVPEREVQERESVELAAGVAALASFQQVTQQGDGKANMLLAVQVGLMAVVATQTQQLHRVPGHGWLAVAFWTVSAVYAGSFVAVGYLIAQVIRPRQALEPRPNAYRLPHQPRDRHAPQTPTQVAAGEHPAATVMPYSTQVWRMAREIGRVAARKNRYVSLAVNWTSVMVLSAAMWLSLVAAVS